MRFLFNLFGFLLTFSSGILVMIYGWGLQPVSWFWIIGGGFFSSLLGAFIITLDRDN